MVIFGASGDLSKRKLLPALYRLAYERRLPSTFSIVGISRTPLTDDAFRDRMRKAVKQFLEDSPFDEGLWKSFAANLHYVAGDMGDARLYGAIKDKLAQLGVPNVLFYLSIQPSYYGPVVDAIGAACLGQGGPGGWRRIVIEKPFGHDLESARALNDRIHRVFPENEVYRIDHYLGKETVQNVLAFRFGNGIFEPVWNRRYVNHVQITAAESIGVEGRGAYYQEAGALRDMIQNHLLQVTATIAMEPSAVYEPDAVRDERAKLLRSGTRWPGNTKDSARSRVSIPARGRTPSRRRLFSSRIGAGPACRFTCAPARSCPSAPPKLRSSTTPRRTRCSHRTGPLRTAQPCDRIC